MPMTVSEKILAAHAGLKEVSAGQYVEAQADLTVTNDTSGHHLVRLCNELGIGPWDRRRFAIGLDHLVPANEPESAHDHNVIREFARRHRLPHFADISCGNHLQIPVERGLVRPGMLIPGNDSHCTMFGALGALGVGIGITETVELLATGRLWFKVPPTIRVRVEGRGLPSGVEAKDVVLEVARLLGCDGATYSTLEFCGPAVEGMGLEERMTLCNMAVEVGAKAGVVEADGVVAEYLSGREDPNGQGEAWHLARNDPGARFERTLVLQAASLGPRVAVPPRVDAVVDVGEVRGTPITQAFIGSCTNGRLSDLAAAARILRGRRVAPGVRLIVTPLSREVVLAAVREGIIEALLQAGALVTGVGCGACTGVCNGVLADDDVCVATINRNFPGRMGARQARIFLASPSTAAASAVAGHLEDPRAFLE
ncbi:MAG: 3-isopropylmalate dehydratase large subunit [Acetobacteraceae bacterium]|nr:3-isopropylmalate dehydratase large subunit [Acetobacteraceae bacterium]